MNGQTGKTERLRQELETLYGETPAVVDPGFFGDTVTAMTGAGAGGNDSLRVRGFSGRRSTSWTGTG